MAGDSAIEWTDKTWNPIRGCTRVSPGCGGPGPHGGCYAERVAARFSGPGQPYEGIAEMRGGKPRWTGRLTFGHDLAAPLRWRKPSRIFVNSMSDLFHEAVPSDEIDRIFAVLALCPRHTLQVLTKRSGRMRAYLSDAGVKERIALQAAAVACERPNLVRSRGHVRFERRDGLDHVMMPWPLPNVWLGVSAEDQQRADERVPDLVATPAAVRFVSAEPLLGRIDFEAIACPNGCTPPDYCNRCYPDGGKPKGSFDAFHRGLDWVIVGGESGPGARPMHPDWARSIRDQCASAGVPFFFKQWGEWARNGSVDTYSHGPHGRERLWPNSPGIAWLPDGRICLRDYSVLEHITRIKAGAAVNTRAVEVDQAALADFYASGEVGPMLSLEWMYRVGKKAAGRLLDGRTHDAMPEMRSRRGGS